MHLTNEDWFTQMQVRESRRARRVRLVVHPPGRVEVVVPPGFDKALLPLILQQKMAWLERTLARTALEYGCDEQDEPPKNISLPAIGQTWQIEYRRGGNRCHEQQGQLLVSHYTEGDWQHPLQRWLNRTAKRVLPPWLDEISRESGLVYEKVTIRTQRTRWGSCSSGKRISLNRGLLFLSPELVHYLMVHELCHTRHMNHSQHYWSLVAEQIPDYKPLDRALRRAFSSIPVWARP